MRCIIREVRRNSGSIATNFEENTAHFSQLEIIILIQSIPRDALNKSGCKWDWYDVTFKKVADR